MPHVNLDGQKLNFNFKFSGNGILQMGIIKFLESNTPFILHDGDRCNAMIVIPEKLVCIHFGEVLFHKGIQEFQFTLGFYGGLYACVDALKQNEISYSEQKLLSNEAVKVK